MLTDVVDAVRFVALQCQNTVCLNLSKTEMRFCELFYSTFINVYNLGLDRHTVTRFIMLCNHSFYLYFTKGLEKSYIVPFHKATAECV
jgi:hypothetical protein